MTDAILDFPEPDQPDTTRRLFQVWISSDLATMIDRFQQRQNIQSKAETVRQLLHLGLADDALYRRKRGAKK